MSEDEVPRDWSLDPAVRTELRLSKVRSAMEGGAWLEALVEVEELLDEEPDHAEALLILGESQLELGDAEGAALSLGRHLELSQPTTRSLSALAVARLDSCDLPGSAEAARETIRLEPDHAEAHYVLGLALEHLPGRGSESLRELVAANRLDAESFPFPLQIDDQAWGELLGEALSMVHPALARFWDGVRVEFHKRPELELLMESTPPMTPRITGLYVGEPPRDEDPWSARPEKLLLFTVNLCRSASRDELLEKLATLLQNEALGWLAMSPEDLDWE